MYNMTQIGIFNKQSYSDSDYAILILDGEDSLRTPLLSLSSTEKTLLAATSCSFVVIGSCFKATLYKFIFKQYTTKSFKPINVLILVAAIIQHTQVILLVGEICLVYLTDSMMIQIFGGFSFVCGATRSLFQIGNCYSFTGGFGLSLFRILYIKRSNWVKYKIGEDNLMKFILFGGLVVSTLPILLPLILGVGYSKLAFDLCLAAPGLQRIIGAIDDYSYSIGAQSMLEYMGVVYQVTASTMLLLSILEITIYISFFRNMYEQNNNEKLLILLGSDVIKKRKKQNATNFFGQFCTFLTEVAMGALILFLSSELHLTQHDGTGIWELAIPLVCATFALTSMVEVMTSSSLKQTLPKIFK